MKIRTGFVSNSSSSAFVCIVCGETDGGFDLSLTDARMVECRKGHILCDAHVDDLQSWFNKFEMDLEERRTEAKKTGEVIHSWQDDNRFIPPSVCPICSLFVLSGEDELEYYRMRFSMSSDDILEDIIETFENYAEFRKALHQSRLAMAARKEE